jgi:tRNA dimethylallyltransferase
LATKNNTVIIIAGPTAVGKTAVAIEVAKHFSTQIISADSRQCYKELNIGVARPTEEELAAVPHYFIATHSIFDKVTAATFEAYALQKANDIFANNNIAVMTGGTGLYIKAFCEGMDAIPDVPEVIRQQIKSEYAQYGLSWLQQQIQQYDPLFFQKGEMQNPQRLMRALEVYKATGKSILQFHKNEKVQRDFNIIKLALELPKEQLHHNINHRVNNMMEAGLLNEVQSLIPYQHINALQTVGYKELFDFFKGEVLLTDAVENIKKNTRQYAKRQMTWFKKDKGYQWFQSGEWQQLYQHMDNRLNGRK